MNCKKCGNPIFENEQYCRNCGEPIDELKNQDGNEQQTNNVNNDVYPKYKLTIIRKKTFVGWAAVFNIYIDNVLVGKVKNGQILELEVNGGNHQISINQNNPINIMIAENTTVETVVFGVNNYGININGQSNINNDEIIKKNKNLTDYLLWFSIILSTVSILMILFWQYYITYWTYAVVIGLGIANISGLRNQKNSNQYKWLVTKNVITIIISTIMLLMTIYITIFL